MARTDFPAGITGILGGGSCYWLVVIRPNATDTWNPQAFGMLTAYSLSGYDVLAGRLLSIGDIDNKIGFDKSIGTCFNPMADIPDVEVEIQNVDGDINPAIFQGRTLEIRFGYGTTMSIATSVVMFSGRIGRPKSELNKITLQAKGRDDKAIGVPLPDDVDDKYKGKIYPMTWGDWTDEAAYAPTVLNRGAKDLPDVALDTEALHTFDALMVYDDDAKIGYRAKNDTMTVLNDDKNLIAAISDTGDTLLNAIGDTDVQLETSGAGTVAQFSTDYGAKPLILKIDDELMLAINVSGSVCKIERGYLWSTRQSHAAGAKIYYYNTDISTLAILVSNIFYAYGVSGMVTSLTPSGTPAPNRLFSYPAEGRYENFIDESALTYAMFLGTIAAENAAPITAYPPYYLMASRLNLVFPKIGIEGAVVKQYMILKAIIRGTIASPQGYLDPKYFWFKTSSVGSLVVLGASLTNNSSTFQIILKPTDGWGWILCERTAGTNDPEASGTLTGIIPGTTQDDIEYSVWYKTQTIGNLYLYKENDSTFQLIRGVTANNSDTDISDDIDNITADGDETEEDFEITNASGQPAGDLLLADVSDLPEAKYAFRLNMTVSPKSNGNVWLSLYRFGMRLDFYVSPLKYYFWWKGKGRKNPGGYFNGDADDLMENPASVIEDFCLTADNGGAVVSLDETSFDAAYTARASWKLAHSVYGKDKGRPKFRDELKTILSCSGLLSFERYDGSYGLTDLDDPGSVTRTITDSPSEIKADSNRFADISYAYLDTDFMITSIEIRYKPILPEKDQYAGICKIDRNTSGPTEYQGYLQQAYETLGEDRALVVEAPAIRDADTAQALAFLIVKLRYKPLVQIEARGSYDFLDIEIGDKVGVDLSLFPSPISAILNAKTYLVTGHRVKPHVNKDKPDVRIILTELGTATIEDVTIWQDSASAPTNVKTETASGGRVIMEV